MEAAVTGYGEAHKPDLGRKRHVWTAPAVQGKNRAFQRSVRVQPCIRPHMMVSPSRLIGQTVIQGGALISAGFPANLTSGGS
jgi:hypothetical protein